MAQNPYGQIGGALAGLSGQNAYNQARQQLQQQAYEGYLDQGMATATSTAYTSTSSASYDPRYMAFVTREAIEDAPKNKKCAKHGQILHDLRKEIDDWHGDILRAA